MPTPSDHAQADYMRVLDLGPHEGDCLRFDTGWLCTSTCPVEPPSENPTPPAKGASDE